MIYEIEEFSDHGNNSEKNDQGASGGEDSAED